METSVFELHFKELWLKDCAVDFVEIIKAAKRIFNFDKICRSYCDFYFGVTILEHTVEVLRYYEAQ